MNASRELTITERLREYAGFPIISRGHRGRLIRAAMLDAAREIDRLAALARPDPVICPACQGERRGSDGRLCARCGGSAQFDRSQLRPGETAPFEG